MSDYTVRFKQSIYDITTEQFGSLDNVFDLVKQNQFTFDQGILAGTVIDVRNEGKGDENIKNAIKAFGQLNNNAEGFTQYGIGVMIIESTFIVA